MSRRLVADLVGRSEEWLRLVERGKLRLDSVQAIIRLAEVLQLEDYRDLIESPNPNPVEPPNHPVRDLLEPLRPLILGHPGMGIPPKPVAAQDQTYTEQRVLAEVETCEDVWTNAPNRYTALAQRLPHALISSYGAHWQSPSQTTRRTLVRVFHVSARLLTGLGAHDLAALASDRALTLADVTDPAPLLAVSGWHWATALLHLGESHRCNDFALGAAENIPLNLDSVAGNALYGALHLLAAKGAATSSPNESTRLMAISHELARPIGKDYRIHGISFGLNEIGLARMEIAYSHRNFAEVISTAAEAICIETMGAGQRAVYYVTLASAYIGHREIVSAAFALTQAAETSPDEIRYSPRAHGVLRQLIENGNRLLSPQIGRLAQLADLH